MYTYNAQTYIHLHIDMCVLWTSRVQSMTRQQLIEQQELQGKTAPFIET